MGEPRTSIFSPSGGGAGRATGTKKSGAGCGLMSELDFGSLNDVLAKNVAAENLARSIDADYTEQFFGDAKAANARSPPRRRRCAI
jgi:hypothetical protein